MADCARLSLGSLPSSSGGDILCTVCLALKHSRKKRAAATQPLRPVIKSPAPPLTYGRRTLFTAATPLSRRFLKKHCVPAAAFTAKGTNRSDSSLLFGFLLFLRAYVKRIFAVSSSDARFLLKRRHVKKTSSVCPALFYAARAQSRAVFSK